MSLGQASSLGVPTLWSPVLLTSLEGFNVWWMLMAQISPFSHLFPPVDHHLLTSSQLFPAPMALWQADAWWCLDHLFSPWKWGISLRADPPFSDTSHLHSRKHPALRHIDDHYQHLPPGPSSAVIRSFWSGQAEMGFPSPSRDPFHLLHISYLPNTLTMLFS